MILPINNFIGNSEGENVVWQKFSEFLPDDFVSFHNYTLGIKEADVMLLVPNLGVLVIEIKGFYGKNIIDVPDNTIIRVKNQPAVPSPFKQAIKYRNILTEDFLKPNGIESVYVTCAVCYPYISHEEYIEKGLNKISHDILTITKDDLENKDALMKKIEDIFEHTYASVAMPQLVKYGFNNELLDSVGNIISQNFRNTSSVKDEEPDEDVVTEERSHYSRLICVKNGNDFTEDAISQMLKDWSLGTKIYFYTSDVALMQNVSKRLESIISEKELDDRKAFKVTNNTTFLFSGGICDVINNSFEIVDGENYIEYSEELENLHLHSSFNKDQYEVEHAELENIIVKAGAGTGKTYSMISRINYLVWKKNYDAFEIKNAIAMITFTNESADAMKEKLSDNFLNYYLLTKDIKYLGYIESVEDMNISTIHSMAKKILQGYSSQLGLGKDFNIITGDFKREQLLHANLNEFIKNNKKFTDEIDITMFLLGKRLHSFMDKLDNKNVDIVSDYETLKFGADTKGLFDDLIEVVRKTQSEMNDYCMTNNSVCLGDLIRKLKVLYRKLKEKGVSVKQKIDFLFVDEFQDTDDIQINLISCFKEIFGFKLFVVGDVKQCIYRFRGAEVKAFDTLASEISEDIKTLSLNKNYRTDIMLMDKLNDVFKKWHKDGNIEYSNKDVLMPTKKLSDTLQFFNGEYNLEGKEFEDVFIKELKKAQDTLADKEKIAILVRYNYQIAEIKEICDKCGINIETEIGGELFRIDPTIDLFKLVLALKYNQSPKYLFNLYTTSYVSEILPKAELWDMSKDEIREYFYNNLPKSLSNWNEYIQRLRTEPVLKVLRDIVDEAKPWDIFSQKIDADGDDVERCESYYIRNLDQLFEKLVLASNTDYLTINKLSDYLEVMILTRREEEARESYDIEKSTSKIICTTVHKSKGLEFDTVILPYCEFDISCAKAKGDVDLIYADNKIGYRIKGNDYESTAFENDLYDELKGNEFIDRKHEETRILYVALTRAIKKVIYLTDRKPNKRGYSDCWKKMIEEV